NVSASRVSGKFFERDADWECPHPRPVIVEGYDVMGIFADPRSFWNNALLAAQEVSAVAFRLEAHQVILQQCTQNLLAPRQFFKNIWRWKRNVKKETNPRRAPCLAQVTPH